METPKLRAMSNTWLVYCDMDILRMLPNFLHDELMLLDIYLGFFLWMLQLYPFVAYFVLIPNFGIHSYLVH